MPQVGRSLSAAQIDDETYKALSRAVLNLQAQRIISPRTMRMATTQLSVDENWINLTCQEIDKAHEQNRHNAPGFLLSWQRQLFQQFNIASTMPQLSEKRFKTAYAYFYPTHGVENWWRSNPYWFVKELAVEGQTALVYGEKGYGKTDHALMLCELLILLKEEHLKYLREGTPEKSNFYQIRRERRRELRFDELSFGDSTDSTLVSKSIARVVAPADEVRKADKAEKVEAFSSKLGLYDSVGVQFPTNISISPNSPFANYFPRCSRMSDFIITMCRGAKVGIFSLPTPDELGFSFNKKRAMSAHNFGIEMLIIVIRKFNAGLLGIAQDLSDQLPAALTASSQTIVQKTSKETAVYDVRGFATSQKVRNVPRTSVKYATRAFATFAVDMNPQLMVAVLQQKEEEAIADGQEWSDAKMYDAAIEFCEQTKQTDAELGRGNSGVLRAEIRWYLQQTDPVTGRPYTPDKIAKEVGGPDGEPISIDIVHDVIKEDQKRARERMSKVKGKKGYGGESAGTLPSLVVVDGGPDASGDVGYDPGPQ